MNFINKVELKYQLEKMGIKVENGYIKKSELEKVILAENEAHPRCTNQSLVPFGIKIKEPLHRAGDVYRVLKQHGWYVLEVGSLLEKSDNLYHRNAFTETPDGKTVQFNFDKIQADYPFFKTGITLKKLVPTLSKGRFILGSSGHSMSIIDGVLYDAEKRGADLRRIHLLYQVFTKEEYEQWAKKYVL